MRATLPSCLLLLLSSLIAAGQGSNRDLAKELGWDLTYSSLLKKNKVRSDDFLAEWLKKTDRSFTTDLLKAWKGDQIVASMLIEFPAPHAGEHVVNWLIRTEKGACLFGGVDKGPRQLHQKEIDPKRLDDAFKTISSWEQAKPMPWDGRHVGYFGFLNYFDRKGTRQMLLTGHDFYTDEPGRLSNVFEALIPPDLDPRGSGSALGRAAESVRRSTTDDLKSDAELIQGSWKVVLLQEGGKKEPPPPPAALEQLGMRIIITKEKYTVKLKDLTDAKTYQLNPAKKWFDLAGVVAPGGIKIGPNLGIYELKGDELKICFGKSGKERPTKFDPNQDPAVDVLLVLKRVGTKS